LVDEQGLKAHVSEVKPFTDKGVKEMFESMRNRRTLGKIAMDLEIR
jgi:hypothetical protein